MDKLAIDCKSLLKLDFNLNLLLEYGRKYGQNKFNSFRLNKKIFKHSIVQNSFPHPHTLQCASIYYRLILI